MRLKRIKRKKFEPKIKNNHRLKRSLWSTFDNAGLLTAFCFCAMFVFNFSKLSIAFFAISLALLPVLLIFSWLWERHKIAWQEKAAKLGLSQKK